MLRSSSPAMKPFEQPMTWDQLGAMKQEASAYMTVSGTVSKTFINLAFACTGALVAWALVSRGILPRGLSIPIGLGLIAVSWIGSMIINSKPQTAKFIGPVLSMGSGAWAAFISFAIAISVGTTLANKPELLGAADLANPATGKITVDQAVTLGSGLIFQAILLTFGVVGAIALATGTGVLRIGNKAAKVITGITGGIMFVYLAGWILRIFGISIPYIHGYGIIGIGFSIFVVILASLNVAMVFSSVLTGVENKLPKHFEWVAGHAIVATVIWLYIEIVILLYKLFASRE